MVRPDYSRADIRQLAGGIDDEALAAEQEAERRASEEAEIRRERALIDGPGNATMPEHVGGRRDPPPARRTLDTLRHTARHTATRAAKAVAHAIEWPILLVLLLWPTEWSRQLRLVDDEAGPGHRVLRTHLERWCVRHIATVRRYGPWLLLALVLTWAANDMRVHQRHSVVARLVSRPADEPRTAQELADAHSLAGRLSSLLPSIDLARNDYSPMVPVVRSGEVAWLRRAPALAVGGAELAGGVLTGVETFDGLVGALPLPVLAAHLEAALATWPGACMGADQIGVARTVLALAAAPERADASAPLRWLQRWTECDRVMVNPRIVDASDAGQHAHTYGAWLDPVTRQARRSTAEALYAERVTVEYALPAPGGRLNQCTVAGERAAELQAVMRRWEHGE